MPLPLTDFGISETNISSFLWFRQPPPGHSTHSECGCIQNSPTDSFCSPAWQQPFLSSLLFSCIGSLCKICNWTFYCFPCLPSYHNGWDWCLISTHSSVVLLLYPGSVCPGLLCTIQSCLLEALLTFWRVFVWDEKGCEWYCCNCFKLKKKYSHIWWLCGFLPLYSCLNWRGIVRMCFDAAPHSLWSLVVFCLKKPSIGNREVCESLDFWFPVTPGISVDLKK